MKYLLRNTLSGIVEEIGPGVADFKMGDEVYGYAGGIKGTGGALAEWMVADARCLAPKPPTMTFAEAAALPVIALTAWSGLFDRARIQPGQSLLVHGGIGGVGHITVQLAHARGIRVAATVGDSSDFPLAQRLGATDLICYKTEQVTHYVERLTHGKGFDVIFDTVGGKNLNLSFQAAAIDGSVITTVARSTSDLSPMHAKGLSLHVIFTVLPLLHNLHREKIGTTLRMIKNLKPLIDSHPFSLWEAKQAHSYVESGKARGKVILQSD